LQLKTTLSKNPSDRPSVKQMVKSPYFTQHINQLLSFTLTTGNGGVDGGLPLPQRQLQQQLPSSNNYQQSQSSSNKVMDSEIADRNIERARQHQIEVERQRDKDSKDAAYHAEREKVRVEQSENLRKMIKERKENQGGNKHTSVGVQDDSADDASVTIVTAARVAHPAPSVQVPTSARQGGSSSNREQAPNYGQRQQQPRSSSRDPQPITAKANYGAPSSSAVVAGGNDNHGQHSRGRERSLADLQAERKREADAIRMQIDAPGGYNNNINSNANLRRGDGRMAGGGYDMIVANNNNNNLRRDSSSSSVTGNEAAMTDYQKQANKIYWENRAAAQAAKARMTALERGPGPLGHDQSPDRERLPQRQIQQYESQGSQRHPPQPHSGGVGGVYDYGKQDNDRYSSNSHMDHGIQQDSMAPEERIAMLRAQRDREREAKQAEHERELQMARERQREEVRKLQMRQQHEKLTEQDSHSAFEVDFEAASQQPPRQQSNVRVGGISVIAANKSDGRNEPLDAGQNRQRKQWGPPPSVEEIRQPNAGIRRSAAPAPAPIPSSALVMGDDDENDLDQLATLPKGGFGNNGNRRANNPRANISGKENSDDSDGGSDHNSARKNRRAHQSDTELNEGERAVLQRLQQQEDKKHAARTEAKEVLFVCVYPVPNIFTCL
jgi:hypothetical protein